MKIKNLDAFEVIDSRGFPTVQSLIELEDGTKAKAMIPSGASTGSKEALELRDEDDNRFGGKGVKKACQNIIEKIWPIIKDVDVYNQKSLDKILIDEDGTENKTNFGANAILAVSLVSARAASLSKRVSLWRHIREAFELKEAIKLPIPTFNVINGGAHSDSGLDIQEYMIIPSGVDGFFEKFRAGSEIYHQLKKYLANNNYRIAIGDEGGFAPRLNSNEEPLELLIKIIEKSGYKLGSQIKIGLDLAASEFYDKETEKYNLKLDKVSLDSNNMTVMLSDWVDKYHIESIEDPLSEFDWSGWENITQVLGNKITITGDDLIVTNPKIIQEAGERKACNASLIKVNQIGTLTETIEAIAKARDFGMKIAVSHRSGETIDDFIGDLAVAVGADYLKSGAPARGERICKYNRIIEIERELKKENRN